MNITGGTAFSILPNTSSSKMSVMPATPTNAAQKCTSCYKHMPPSKLKTCERCRKRFKGYRDARASKPKEVGNSRVVSSVEGNPRKCTTCKVMMPGDYTYKMCLECRERTRKYQAERARQKRTEVIGTTISRGASDMELEEGAAANRTTEEMREIVKIATKVAGNATWETIREGDTPEVDAPGSSPSVEPESEEDEGNVAEEGDKRSSLEMDEEQARLLDGAMQVDELEDEGASIVNPSTSDSPMYSPVGSTVPTTTFHMGDLSATAPPSDKGEGLRSCTVCKAPVGIEEKFKLCLECRLNRRDYQRMRNQRFRQSQSATVSTPISISPAKPTASLRHPSLSSYHATVSSAFRSPSASTSHAESSMSKLQQPVLTSNDRRSIKRQEAGPSTQSPPEALMHDQSPYTTKPLSLPSTSPAEPLPSSQAQSQTTPRKREPGPGPFPPMPEATSGKRCTTCKAWLPKGYEYKLCDKCRERNRRYQNERNERMRAMEGREKSTRGRKKRKLDTEPDKKGGEEKVVKMEEVEEKLNVDMNSKSGEDKGNEPACADTGGMDAPSSAGITVSPVPPGFEAIASYFAHVDQMHNEHSSRVQQPPSWKFVPVSFNTPVSNSLSSIQPNPVTGTFPGPSTIRSTPVGEGDSRLEVWSLGWERKIKRGRPPLPAASSVPVTHSPDPTPTPHEQRSAWLFHDPSNPVESSRRKKKRREPAVESSTPSTIIPVAPAGMYTSEVDSRSTVEPDSSFTPSTATPESIVLSSSANLTPAFSKRQGKKMLFSDEELSSLRSSSSVSAYTPSPLTETPLSESSIFTVPSSVPTTSLSEPSPTAAAGPSSVSIQSLGHPSIPDPDRALIPNQYDCAPSIIEKQLKRVTKANIPGTSVFDINSLGQKSCYRNSQHNAASDNPRSHNYRKRKKAKRELLSAQGGVEKEVEWMAGKNIPDSAVDTICAAYRSYYRNSREQHTPSEIGGNYDRVKETPSIESEDEESACNSEDDVEELLVCRQSLTPPPNAANKVLDQDKETSDA